MNLQEFINLDNPEYNFEFENNTLAKNKLDTYSRYFTYKANSNNARNSIYVNGQQFAIDSFIKYNNIADCDGTLNTNEKDTCLLSREIYHTLWKWNDNEHGALTRFGICENAPFGLVGPDTMNSAQTIVNKIIKEAFSKCTNENIRSLRNGNISVNFTLELFANTQSNKTLISWLDSVDGLKCYLNHYHTLGNFVLIPAYFNTYRASIVNDYWDQSLELLKTKNEEWVSNKHEIEWNKDFFTKYINYFFLWDYVESYQPKIISNHNKHSEYLKETTQKIKRRSQFMLAMLKIHNINSDFYNELLDNIFNTDQQFDSYKTVINQIKKKSCYSDTRVKTIIDALEECL